MTTLTADRLPERFRAPVLAATATAYPTPATMRDVLTCQHGVACPACVLAAARAIVSRDASLAGDVPLYTG